MTTPTSMIFREAAMLGRRALIDGTIGGCLEFYPMTPPARSDLSAGQILLCKINFELPCGPVTIDSNTFVVQLNATVPRTSLALVTGLIGWARLATSSGQGLCDLPVGLPASGKPVIVTDLQLYAGGEITLLSMIVREA